MVCKKKLQDCDTDNGRFAPYPLPICSDNLIFVPLRTLRRVQFPRPQSPSGEGDINTLNIIYYGKI